MLKVAIDSGTNRAGDSGRGIGYHTKLLIQHLAEFKDLEISLVDAKNADLYKFDLIHFPAFDTHHGVLPATFSNKTIVTVHDVIKLIYPKAYPLGIKGKFKFLQQKKRLQKANAIITISETSKKDIVRLLGIPAEKIHVVYLAPQEIKIKPTNDLINQTKKRYNLPNKFVLYIGGVNYNKNLLNLAKACKLSKTKLVMVGKETTVENFERQNTENKPWAEFLNKYKYDNDIIRLGYLPEEELACIWKLAIVYCQPSLYEGFGLPLLEAFEHKIPVIASRTQALVEVGGEACLYFDPIDFKNLSEKIAKLTSDKKLQDNLVKKGIKRLKDFSWDKTAKQTYEVYKQVKNS